MSDNTKIEWTDATWNPITGCSVVSAGCKNCYAMKLAGTRLQHHPSRAGLTVFTKNGPVWTGEVRFNEQWLDQPLRWERPRMVFVCAHADLFHPSVPDEWIVKVFKVMRDAPQHVFQVLTKRAERMRDFVSVRYPVPLANVWLGVSVEDRATADERIPLLLDTPASVRWISAEPLLGSVDLTMINDGTAHRDVPREEWGSVDDDDSPPGLWWNVLTGERTIMHGGATGEWSRTDTALDWVIAGGESGPRARPMHPDWVRSLRNQCAAAGVPFLFKQWGEWAPADAISDDDDRKLQEQWITIFGRHIDPRNGIDIFKGDDVVYRAGKKHTGRLLDGVQHDGYPGDFKP